MAARRLKDLMKLMKRGMKLLSPSQREEVMERAISAHRLMEKIWIELDRVDQWLVDVLVEGERFTAIVFDTNANLWARDVIFDGDNITLAEGVRVSESFESVPNGAIANTGAERELMRGSIKVTRMPDDSYRWFMRACTSALNRVLEIDSDALFDTFTERFNSGDYPTPYLTVRHSGRGFYMGDTDFVRREGNILLMSGTFDPDENNTLARAAEESLVRDSDYWGVSIGYDFEKGDALPHLITHRVRTGKSTMDLQIPVYTEGTLLEASILNERECSAFYTDVIRVEVMDTMTTQRKQRDLHADLMVLYNQDEAAVDAIINETASAQRKIDDSGMITRDLDDADSEDNANDADEESSTGEADSEAVVLELDLGEHSMEDLATALAANPEFVAIFAGQSGETEDEGTLEGIRSGVANLTSQFHDMSELVDELVAEREQDESDAPRRSIKATVRGARPRERHAKNSKTKSRAKKKQPPEDDFDEFDHEEVNELLDGIAATIPAAYGDIVTAMDDGS